MMFTARIRESGNSKVITLPNEIVEKFKLKEGDIKQFAVTEEDD